jgi:hypothetical protein
MTKIQGSTRMLALLALGAVLLVAPAVQAQEGEGGRGMTVRGTVLYNPLMNDCLQEACPRDLALAREQDWTPPTGAVNVVVRGTGIVAKTDRQGRYQITVPSPDSELVYHWVGHERVVVPVQGRSTIDVRLTPTPLPVIERLLALIMPQIEVGIYPNIDQLALDANVNRETASDILWLVIGNRVMMREYPGQFFPDFRFDTAAR